MQKIPYHIDNNSGWYEIPLEQFNEKNQTLTHHYSIIDEEKKVVYLEHNTDGFLFLKKLRDENTQFKAVAKYYPDFNPIRTKLRQKGY